MDNAVVGLVGTFVGAILVGGFNLLNEKVKWGRQKEADDLKWKRESQVRYNDDRLAAYAHFLRAGDELLDADWSEGPPETLEREYGLAYQMVELLASPLVRPAAESYLGKVMFPALLNRHNRTARRHSREPYKDPPGTAPILGLTGKPSVETSAAIREARNAFIKKVREELGTIGLAEPPPESGENGPPRWWQLRRRWRNRRPSSASTSEAKVG